MLGTKAKSQQSLERTISKYAAKFAKAPNPTQRQYASRMLHMAKDALAKSQDGEPVIEADDEDVVELNSDEYAEA